MKISKLLLCSLLLVTLLFSSATAQGVNRAAQAMDESMLAHYPAFTQDGDKLSVNAIQADALMDRFWTAGSKMHIEMCAFHLALEGNVSTGVWTPVLRFYYMDAPKAINARAVSLLADGVRYDLAASSERVTLNRTSAELITAPLTAEAITALQALTQAERMSVRLLGDEIYTTTLISNPQNERGQIEQASVLGLDAGFALFREAGLFSYDLWDLSAAAWESEHGYRPLFARHAVISTLREAAVADPFGMIMVGDHGPAALAAQTILVENGFLYEKTSNILSQNASNAVVRAQHYLGMVETGCMDAVLEQALAQGRQNTVAAQPELQTIGSTAGVALDRYWFARSVSASANEQSQYTVHNTDNVFLAADGVIRNLSSRQLHLFMQLQANVVYNGTAVFTAELACEGSEGTVLDTLLLPMAQARLIVYAEVPSYLAADPSASWTIQLSADGQTFEFDLQ